MLVLWGHYAIILGILPGTHLHSLQSNAASMEVWAMVIMEQRIHINKGTSHEYVNLDIFYNYKRQYNF